MFEGKKTINDFHETHTGDDAAPSCFLLLING
jgi:hypothetical protein